MANGLATELNKPVDPFNVMSQLSTGDIASRGAAARRIKPEFARAEQQAEEEFAISKQEAGLEQRQAETRAQEDFATGQRGAVEQYQQQMPARPMFTPTEYDDVSAAKTAMLTAVLGAITGGSSARGALRAMRGATEGARLGREDLYNTEVKRFEQELGAWKDNIRLAKEKLDQTINLLSTDKNAALAKAKELDPILQRGTVLADVRRQAFVKARKDLENAEKAADQLTLDFAKGGSKGGLKPGVDLVNKHLMKMRLSGYAQQMQNALKDPEFAQKIDKYRALAFAQEQSPIADQILQQQIPEDVRQFLILAKRFRNEVYRTESGLAVTAYEQLRQYGAVPQPGDSARALVTKLMTLEKGMRDDMANEQRVFPDLLVAAQRQGLAPVTAQTQRPTEEPAGEAIAPGTVMDGFRFKGGDPANKNNWEQVQ